MGFPMEFSRIVQGSRFYMPRGYCGPDRLEFTHVTNQLLIVRACQVSCFELLAMPGVLRNYVVIHAGNQSWVVLETKEEVLAKLEDYVV